MNRYILVYGPTGQAELCLKAASERAAKAWITRNVGYRNWDMYFICEG